MPLFQMRFRRDTTANWQAANPILLDGEVGYERTENGLLLTKMGDGVMGADGIITGTSWNDLPYVSGPAGSGTRMAGNQFAHQESGRRLGRDCPVERRYRPDWSRRASRPGGHVHTRHKSQARRRHCGRGP